MVTGIRAWHSRAARSLESMVSANIRGDVDRDLGPDRQPLAVTVSPGRIM